MLLFSHCYYAEVQNTLFYNHNIDQKTRNIYYNSQTGDLRPSHNTKTLVSNLKKTVFGSLQKMIVYIFSFTSKFKIAHLKSD
jgi:hypothetical protein